MDIGEGVVGRADVLEEIARMYGYDNIPEHRLTTGLPPAHSHPDLEVEERARDILARLGMQEVINYRLTSPEREQRLTPPGEEAADLPYIRLTNPLTPERIVMRRSLLGSALDLLEKNIRLRDRLAFFEIGAVFLPVEGQQLPDEPVKLALAMSGKRDNSAWDAPATQGMDFYDLKGIVEGLLDALHIEGVRYLPESGTVFHPGKCARVVVGEQTLGVFGELHPQVKARYDFLTAPVLAGEFDMAAILAQAPHHYATDPVPTFPPVLEDLAVVVDEDLPADKVAALIKQTGGKLLTAVRLFDIFRGEQIGAGKKSLAYSLTYQALDRTLKDEEVKQLRGRILRRLEQELGAKLRS
jgi:phenylalanyl-tRNA synthetase beta chain